MNNLQQLHDDKLHIISWINNLQDTAVVDKLKLLMLTSHQEYSIVDEQKNAIDEALLSVKEKGVFSHASVLEETQKRYPHLYNQKK